MWQMAKRVLVAMHSMVSRTSKSPLRMKKNQRIPESSAGGSRHFGDYILNTFEDLPRMRFRTA
jgi:hypothetical protein